MGYSSDRISIVLPTAIGVIILVALLNTVGSSMGGTIQTIATVCKLVPLILIIIFGFIKGNGNPIIQPLVGPGVSVGEALNGYLLTGPRVPYALSIRGIFPFSSTFGKLNKGDVPANSIWLVAILASLYALSGKFNLLTDLTVFTIWVFYVFTFIGVMKLRKDKPNL